MHVPHLPKTPNLSKTEASQDFLRRPRCTINPELWMQVNKSNIKMTLMSKPLLFHLSKHCSPGPQLTQSLAVHSWHHSYICFTRLHNNQCQEVPQKVFSKETARNHFTAGRDGWCLFQRAQTVPCSVLFVAFAHFSSSSPPALRFAHGTGLRCVTQHKTQL